MAYNVEQVRQQFPALGDGRAWLDGAAGTQVPETVIEAMAQAHRVGLSNLGGTYDSSQRSTAIVQEARVAVADLTGAPDPECVVFGPSATALTYRFAGVLAEDWRPGDEVVVTQLDHDANVRPWIQHARRRGASVRIAEIDPVTGELPTERITELIGDRTRVVAVTVQSNLLGNAPEVRAIADRARSVGAVSFVDGVQHCPHAHVRLDELGVDFYATSAYKWAGPHQAAVVAADAWSLETLHPDKLAPAPNEPPERFELGTNPFAAMAGIVAAVEHWASLDPAAEGTRRQRLAVSRDAAAEHERRLGELLSAGLRELPGVVRHGEPSGMAATPLALFTVDGHTPAEAAARLASRGINVSHGHAYAWEAVHALGLGPSGAVRASLSHYTSVPDVRRLLEALGELTNA